MNIQANAPIGLQWNPSGIGQQDAVAESHQPSLLLTSLSSSQNDTVSIGLSLTPTFTPLGQAAQLGQTSQGQSSSMTDYTNNSNIVQRMNQLGQGDPQIEPLMTQLTKLDPESAEAQQLKARISAQWKGSPEELKEVFTLDAVRQLNNQMNKLQSISANMGPFGVLVAFILKPRIDEMSARRQTLIDQLGNPTLQTPPSTTLHADLKNNLIVEHRMQQLGQGDPQTQQLITQLLQADPSSIEAQFLSARISAQWKGSPEELNEMLKLNSVRQLNTMLAGLNNQLSNLAPGSSQADAVSTRIDEISARRQTLIDGLK